MYKIVPFHKDFSPSVEQLEYRNLVHELQHPIAGWISQILLLYKTWRYYNKFDSTKSLEYVTDMSKYDNAGKCSID